MPTNPNSPFGFRFITLDEPSSPNYGLRKGLIKGGSGGNSHAIYAGDLLTVPSAGYYDVFTAAVSGTTLIGGVAESFEWVSLSQGMTVRQGYYPGTPTDASGDITVNFYCNPLCVFEAQCLLGPVTQANVGMYANFNVGSGGSSTSGGAGFSSFTVDDSTASDTRGTTPQLPLRIYRLPVFGPLAPQYSQAGYDATQAYNRVWVTIASLTPL